MIFYYSEIVTNYNIRHFALEICNLLLVYFVCIFTDSYFWCLNRHLCILPERFAKKDLNLVIVCHKDVT